jgi:tRNA modification GTPase
MISTDDTIVAIATPLGAGGLGVVRMSGPGALGIAARVFSGADLTGVPSHTLHHGWVLSGVRSLDETVAAVFRAPRSYTGEDVVEFSCHGSSAVLTDLVALLQAGGARAARPGEFTERAFLNGKIDLVQAEAVADLINARSSAARQAAADQLRGALSAQLRSLRDGLLNLVAHLEANLDFVEEDIPGLARDSMRDDLTALERRAAALVASAARGRLLRSGVAVALVGRPNVGKSSLFNALLGHDRAIVTPVPGTTRDTLEEGVAWEGTPVDLTDTAGLRQTSDPVEALGTERSRRAEAAAEVVLAVVDASAPLTSDDLSLLSRLRERKAVAVLNKSDLGIDPSARAAVADFVTAIETSAATGAGLDALRAAALAAAHGGAPETESAAVVTNVRHAELLERARAKMAAGLDALAAGRSEEAVAIDLGDALEALGAITGEALTEDILSAIFRRFCVGK